jgi:hypothetical protein
MIAKSSFGLALILGSLMLLIAALGCTKAEEKKGAAEATGKTEMAAKNVAKKAEPAAPRATMVVYTIADA